jgi:hypothetical protein
MDKLTFCNNYLYSCWQVIVIFVDKLSFLWCLFSLIRYVCWLCLYVEMVAMRWSWPINEHRLKGDDDWQTSVSFVHCRRAPTSRQWRVPSDFNYWALKLLMSVKCSSVTDFIAPYQYGVISNGLKHLVTDRHWSITDFTSSLPIGLTCVMGFI